jgi:hypothetical protein
MIPMFSVSSRNKDKEMFMTGSQEVVGSNPIFSTLESNTDLLEMKLIKIQKPESKSRKG